MPRGLIDGLNPDQQRAVTSTAPVILCLAGAGSGKTTVLTRRVANLHLNHRVGTVNMLCLTFTRLAGKEMKERVIKLIGEEEGKRLFMNTFHAFAVSVLRRWGHKVGLEPNFTIYGQEDRDEILKRITEEFGKRTTLNKVLALLEDPGSFDKVKGTAPEECRVITEYLYRCKQNNAIDLNLLIPWVVKLWSEWPEALKEYHYNFSYVFVDEFQDTSDDQMTMLQLLNPKNLFVVGDDFQAIYGWRRARVEYILNFPNEYPGCEVVKLEDNYRSTYEIVDAANSVIKRNVNQAEKTLRAHKSGIDIVTYAARDSDNEAVNIANLIKSVYGNRKSGVAWKDIAILARTNGQVDTIQRVLEDAGVPAQRVAGRNDPLNSPMVRQIFNWMYFLYNRRDNVALKKCLRQHSVKQLQLNELEFKALTDNISLWEAMQGIADETHFCKPFIKAVGAIEARLETDNIYRPIECFKVINELLGLSQNFQSPLRTKVETSIMAWEESKRILGENDSIQAFLKFLRYRDIQEKLIEEQDAVKLMTVHASKGLEFDTVVLAGLNQDIFPSRRGDIEEERRLFYVAVTRAKNRLYVTWPEQAPDWKGTLRPVLVSQFVEEMNLAGKISI